MKIHLTIEGSTIRRSVIVGVLLWLSATFAVSALGAAVIIYGLLIPQWQLVMR